MEKNSIILFVTGLFLMFLSFLHSKDFKTYIKDYKERRRKETFQRGFEWAMSEYFLRGKDIEEIELYVDTAIDYNGFDQGARRAIVILAHYQEMHLKNGELPNDNNCL